MIDKIAEVTDEDVVMENDNKEHDKGRNQEDGKGWDRKGRNERDNVERSEENGENYDPGIQPASETYVSWLICNAIVENKHLSQRTASNPRQEADIEPPQLQDDEGTQFFRRILVICTTLKLVFLSQGNFMINSIGWCIPVQSPLVWELDYWYRK